MLHRHTPGNLRHLVFTMGVALAVPAVLHGQTVVTKLQPVPSSSLTSFGAALAADRGVVAVTEELADGSGAVHMFDHVGTVPGAGWIERAVVVPADTAPGQRFGASLALQFDTLIVGAPGDAELGPSAGAVYAYVRDRKGTENAADDTWHLLGKLHAEGVNLPPGFGSVVDLATDVVVAGAESPDANSAFVFARDKKGTADPLDDTFQFQQQLLQAPGAMPTSYGVAVGALPNEHFLVVSDTLPSAVAPTTGSVTVLVRHANGTLDPLDDHWVTIEVLVPDETIGGVFGTRLALGHHGRRLFVTADQAGPGGTGRIVTWDHDNGVPANYFDDTWTKIGTLESPDPNVYAGFGSAMAVRSDHALISADAWVTGPPGTGRATFLYERVDDAWVLVDTLRAPDEAVGDGFGTAVYFGDDDTALIGAVGSPYVDDEPAVDGSVYVVEVGLQNPWTLPGVPAIPSIAGWGGLLPNEPITLRLYNSFDFGAPELLVIGLSAINLPFKGLTFVPAPDVLVPLVLGPDGSISITTTWPAAPFLPSGFQLFFQGWIPPAVRGFDWKATPGMSVTVP